jgi:DHA2 family multidrug resistance protein
LPRRNVVLGGVSDVILGMALYGSVYLLPGPPVAEQIGQVLAWTGLPRLMLIPCLPWPMRRIDGVSTSA